MSPVSARAATFDSSVAGAWDSSGTWQVTSGSDVDGIPDADDAVDVDLAVTVSTAGEAAQSLAVGAAALTVSGSTASLAVGSGGGTLTGALNVSNGASMSSSGTISQSGVVRVSGTGAETISNTGLWIITGTGSTLTVDNGTFVNAGTLRRDGGAGEVLFDATLTNSGAVEVTTGTLRLRSGSGGTGTHTIAEGATLAFSNNLYTVTGSGSVSGAGRVLSLGQGLNEASAGLTMGPDTSFSVGTLELDAGTVTLNATTPALATTLLGDGGIRSGTGQLNIGAGPSRLSGARLSATGTTTFAPAATLPITSGGVLNGHTLNLPNTTTLSGGLEMSGAGAERVNNPAAGAVTITGTGSTLTVDNGVFVNAGTLRRDGGAGEVLFDATLANSGAVEVTTGTLRLRSGSGGTGTHTIAEGATLAFSNNLYTVTGSGSVSGAGRVLSLGQGLNEASAGLTMGPDTSFSVGTLELDAGTVTLNATTPAQATTLLGDGGVRAGSGVLNIGAGPSRLSGARLSGTGTTTFAPAATLAITSGGVLNGHTLNLPNTTTLSGGLEMSGAGAERVNNPAAGAVTITGTGSTLTVDNGVFVNAGTLRRDGGAGEVLFDATLANSGAVEVTTGTLRLRSGSGGTGTHTIAEGATLAFSNNLYTVTGSGSVSGAGRVLSLGQGLNEASAGLTMGPDTSFSVGTLELDAGTVTLNATTPAQATTLLGDGGVRAGSGVLNIGAGPSRLSGARLSATGTTVAKPEAALTLGAVSLLDTHHLRLEGDRTFAPAGVVVAPGAVIENAGRLVLAGGGASGAGALHNLPGATILQDVDTTATLTLTLVNDGELTVARGTLQAARVTQAAGELRIGRRATLTGDLIVTGGTANVGGTLGGSATITGGRLSGAGAVDGTLTNSGGTVSAGSSPGLLVVKGNFIQEAGGTLLVDVEGLLPCSEHDRIDVTGSATFAGTLAIANDPGFTPNAGTALRIVNAASTAGAFATVTGAQLGGGLSHAVSVKPDGVDLIAGVSRAATGSATASDPSDADGAANALTALSPVGSPPGGSGQTVAAAPASGVRMPARRDCSRREIAVKIARRLARRARYVEIRVGRRRTRVAVSRARSGVRLALPSNRVTVGVRVATREGGSVHKSITYAGCLKASA